METMLANQKITGLIPDSVFSDDLTYHLTKRNNSVFFKYEHELCMYLTCVLVMLDLNPLISEGSEPALFLLWLLGTQEVDLITSQRAQLQGILHTDVEVLLLAILHLYHLHVVHVHPTLVVQHVPAQEVLQ